jgi:hypothetical protein
MNPPVQSPSALPSYPPMQSTAPAHQPVSLRKIFAPFTSVISHAPLASISFHTRESSSLPSSNPNPSRTDSNRNLLTLCSVDYSACSCAGVTGVTTTAPTPTVTVTETSTVTCALERKVKRGLEAAGGMLNFGRM